MKGHGLVKFNAMVLIGLHLPSSWNMWKVINGMFFNLSTYDQHNLGHGKLFATLTKMSSLSYRADFNSLSCHVQHRLSLCDSLAFGSDFPLSIV